MNLRTCRSLSPSAVMCLENTPVEFWFRYIAPIEWKSVFKQTRPMAYGSAFDGHVKECLAKTFKKTFSEADVARFGVLSTVDEHFKGDKQLKAQCIKLGDAYLKGPPGAHLKRFTPTILEGDPKIVRFGSVPIYGKLDVRTTEPRTLDFKVSGSNSSAYPLVGYSDGWLWDFKTGRFKATGPHKFYGTDKASIVRNKPDWAFQLATYDMIAKLETGMSATEALDTPAPIGIDQVTFLENGKIHFTHIREDLSPEFKKTVQERYVSAWRRVKLGRVLPAQYAGMDIGELSMHRSDRVS